MLFTGSRVRVTSAFSKRRNAPLCCAQRSLSTTSSMVNDKNEVVGKLQTVTFPCFLEFW